MRYTVSTAGGEDVSLEKVADSVVVSFGLEEDSKYRVFNTEEFKEFQRAVGYVRSEVEAK